MKPTLLLCGFVAAAVVWGSTAFGQEEIPEVIRLTIHPAAAPIPALKYRLLPGFLERRPGDAAVVYNRMWAERQNVRQEIREKWRDYYEWWNTPLDKLPLARVDDFVRMTEGIYNDYRWAARLDSCDWSLPIREGNPLLILLPDIQEKREPARMIAVRARLQIARGQFDDAIETLRTGYALGRNLGESDVLVSSLVGMAICGIMSDQIQTMIQQPGCPNLYWTLSDLPRPLVSARRSFRAEYDLLYLAYPELLHVGDPVGGADYARLWIERMVQEPTCWSEGRWAWGSMPSQEEQSQLRATLAAMMLRGYPVAKRALIAGGQSPEEVEAMPVAQVVAIYSVQVFNELRDEQYKWFALPWWQAGPGLERTGSRLKAESRRREVIPFASRLLSAIENVKFAEARCDRQIALLRTIEALRLYAAAHDGQMPGSLSDVTEAPIPMDPMTGRPIECRIKNGVAVLDVFLWTSSLKKGLPQQRYEIRMAK